MDLFKNSNFLKISILSFISAIGQLMLNTLLPRYAHDLGASSTLIGFVVSSFTISAFLLKSISGPMVDHFHKVKILAISFAVVSLAFFGYSQSTSITQIIIFRLIHGSGMAFTAVATLSILTDIVSKDKLMQAVAYYGTFQALAGAVGPSIGLSLSSLLGYSNTFLIGMLTMIVSIFMTLSIKVDYPKKTDQKMKISLSKSVAVEALIPTFILVFLALVYSTITAFITLYADDVQVKNIGLFFTVNALSLLISRPLLGRLSKTYKEYILLPYAIVIFMIALFVFSISTHLIGFIISAVLLAFGFGLAHPLIQTLCMKSVPKERSGAASATNYYGMDIGYLLSPFIAGYLIDLLGYALMYRWLILALFISLILNFIFRKRLKAISDFL